MTEMETATINAWQENNDRYLAAALAWLRALAPFDVQVVATGKDAAVFAAAEQLAAELDQAGLAVLLDDRAAVVRPTAQHGQRRPPRPPALDEDDRDFVAHRQAVAGLETGPNLGYLVQRQRLRRDADVLDLVIRVVEQVVGRQDGGDLFGVEHRVVVRVMGSPAERRAPR